MQLRGLSNDVGVRHLSFAVFGLALVSVALTGWFTDGRDWERVPTTGFATLPVCPDVASVQWLNEQGEVVHPNEYARMNTNASIAACPSSPGTLVLTLGGSTADGIGSRAVLVQGTNRLLDVELRDEERTFEVDVPAQGQLLLAFVNDYYDPPEDRNLWVSGLAFTQRAP